MSNIQIAVVSTSPISISLIHYLSENNQLAGVLMPGALTHESYQLHEKLVQNNVPVCQYQDNQVALEHLDRWQADLGVVFGCGVKISPELSDGLRHSMVNFHASALPEYRGPQPVYWQIRNGERNTMLTAHRLEESFDTGDIVAQWPIDIDPLETHHLLFGKIATEAMGLVETLVEQIYTHGELRATPQASEFKHAAPRVQEKDLAINWKESSALEICNQIRASNPHLGGARATFGKFQGNVLQATPSGHPTYDLKPGTVVHVSLSQGLIVALKDECIRLDIIGDSEGFYDGYRYAELIQMRAGMELK